MTTLKFIKFALIFLYSSSCLSIFLDAQQQSQQTTTGFKRTTTEINLETTSAVTLATGGDEILTSTVSPSSDSLGAINSDETTTATILIGLDEKLGGTESDLGAAAAATTATEADPLEGIQGKSISTSDNDFNNNNYESDKNNGKLMTISNNETNSENVSITTVINVESTGTNSDENNSGSSNNEPSEAEEQVAVVKSKNKKASRRVNMTQIDEIYTNGHKSEGEVVDSWLKMGKKLKKAVGNVIGSMVPVALNMTQEARISNECSGAMLKWVLSMNHLKTWALGMLDASGKPVAGLMEGSITMFGNYRQCLKIRAPDDDEIEFAGEFKEYFRGKYCVVQAKPWLPKKERFYGLNSKIKSLMESQEENPWYDRNVFDEINEWLLAFNYLNIRMDLCIPSLCSREDIQSVINFLLKGIDFKARVLRCEMDSPDSSYSSMIETNSKEIADALIVSASTDLRDDNKKTTLELFSQLGWLLVPLTAIIIVLIASFITFIISAKDSINDNDEEKQLSGGSSNGRIMSDNETLSASLGDSINNQTNDYDNDINSGSRRFKQTITKLSLKKSLNNHYLNVDYNQLADEKPLALYGLRFILIVWVLIVEFAINLKFEYLRELLPLKDLIFWWPLQIFINSTLQYDSIILLTAFTMSYKNCLNFNTSSRSLIKFIFDKYIRLMPSIMITVAFTILLPLLYRGPVWNDYVTKQSSVCQSTGWLNMFFLQSYLPYKEICLPQSWLLSVEFQLILLMAPVIYYLNKSYYENYSQRQQQPKDTIKTTLNSQENNTKLESNNNSNSTRPFFWFKTTPGLILTACIALGSGYSFYNVYSKDLPPSYLYTMPDPDTKAIYFDEHFMRLWTHLTVFAIGILAGIECRRMVRNIYIKHNSRGVSQLEDHQGAGGVGFRKANLINSYHANNNNVKDCFRKINYRQSSSSTSTTSLPIISLSSNNSETSSKTSSNNQLIDSKTNESSTSSNVSINMNTNTATSNASTIDNIKGISSKTFATTNNHHYNNQMDYDSLPIIKNNSRGWICSFLLHSIGSVIAITIMSLIIFSTYDWSMYELPKPLVAALYDAGSRLLWSLAFIWFLYLLCVPNETDKSFSFVSKMLGHPVMVCLGKLSFLIYLIHPIVHTTVLAIQEQPIYSSWLMLFHILIGNMTITIALALFISLFVEVPCRNLFRRNEISLLLTKPTRPACNYCQQSSIH